MVWAIFRINRARGFGKFWNYPHFTREISKSSKMHSGNLSQIALSNTWLLVQNTSNYRPTGLLLIQRFSTTTSKVFTLALCGLSLWLIISWKVSEFVQLHRYLSPVSLRLQQLYPNTSCVSNRPKNLEMLFPSVGSLHRNNWDQSAVIHPSTHLVAVIVADCSSVAISWDSSNILLLSGDVYLLFYLFFICS